MANKFLSSFVGGMNTKASPLLLKDTECELIENYNLDTTGALSKRTGYTVLATQPVAARRILGLFQYTNTATTAETTQVMVINNSGNTQSVIYYNNASTWSTSKTNDTALTTVTNFNRARFVTFLDYLFRVNGTDVVGTSIDVNGSTWGTTNAPGTITPSFVVVFEDRVYMAHSGAGDGSRVYFSSLPSIASAPTITWTTATDFFDVNPDDGDEITALENNGNRLLILKTRSLYRWTFGLTEPDRLIGVGTHSQECVKTNLDLGITFFANEYGAYAYTGERPKLISRPIQSFFDAIPATDLNDMCAETDYDHYYLYLSDSLTVDSVTYTNVMAVYTISLDAWVIYTLNATVRVMAKLIISGAEDIYFGSSNGRTYQWNSGLTDNSSGTNSDTATAVHARAITKDILLAYPIKTNIEYVDVISANALLTGVYYMIDRTGDFLPLADLKTRFQTLGHIGKEGRTIRLQFSDSASIASRIEAINIEHIPLEERRG